MTHSHRQGASRLKAARPALRRAGHHRTGSGALAATTPCLTPQTTRAGRLAHIERDVLDLFATRRADIVPALEALAKRLARRGTPDREGNDGGQASQPEAVRPT